MPAAAAAHVPTSSASRAIMVEFTQLHLEMMQPSMQNYIFPEFMLCDVRMITYTISP